MWEKEKNLPLVTVVMPAYNAEKTIVDSIQSLREQSFANWELLVIDDGSSDGTVALVEKISAEDPRVILCKNPENCGAAGTRNRALEMSKGDYVAFLDSDDQWRPEKLEKQLKKMQEHQADLSYTSYAIVNQEGQKHAKDYVVPETISYQELLCQNYIGCSTVMMTRDVAKNYRFSTEYYHEDYVLWLEILRDGKKVIGLQEILMDYCYRPDSRAGNKKASAKYRWIIYRNCLKLPLLRSLYYLGCYAWAGVKKYCRK